MLESQIKGVLTKIDEELPSNRSEITHEKMSFGNEQ